MGHVVFAAPGTAWFHLHDRLQRELQRHGHRVEALFVDPVAHTFWRQQDLPATLLQPTHADPQRAPLDELAAVECLRLGVPTTRYRGRRKAARVRRQLAALLPAAIDWFDRVRPSLVLLHQDRSAIHALLQFVARQAGTRVLWTGEGLLPHTLQRDERGLDGDSSASGRSAGDFRTAAGEPSLLKASLANLLARSRPSALARRELRVPPLRRRLHDVLPALRLDGLCAVTRALRGDRAAAPAPEPWQEPFVLPKAPYVAVLLQEATDPRVLLDAHPAPSANDLVHRTVAAAERLDPGLQTVVVLPRGGIPTLLRRALAVLPRVHLLPADAAPDAVATAVATTTINHPLAIGALLAGTPVLHTGRALYGLPGVTWHAPATAFADLLPRAVAEAACTLRERFLSQLLGRTHLWCSATHPDHNGMLGLAQAVEAQLGAPRPREQRAAYRAGPAWPLAAEGRGT